MEANYYKVLAKCGHVGRNRYIIKSFYVKAENGKEAAKIVRDKPRVKHHHKDTIKEVIQIKYEEYINGIKIMSDDMYFKVHNRQDQIFYNCVKPEELYLEIDETKNQKSSKEKTWGRRKFEAIDKEYKRLIQRGEYDG